jgi:flavin-dependent dehydrogenase
VATHALAALQGRSYLRVMFDAIVMGARCAGSRMAMLLARKGYRVLLVDKAVFSATRCRRC